MFVGGENIVFFLVKRNKFGQFGLLLYFCRLIIELKEAMETLESTTSAAVRTRRSVTKKSRSVQDEIPKTPESELMSVEEYFDIVWQNYLKKYTKLHS